MPEPQNPDWVDPIVEEVREIRDQHAAQFGYDVTSICEALQRDQRTSDRPVVSRPPKSVNDPPAEGAA